jgi:hypothetical protein
VYDGLNTANQGVTVKHFAFPQNVIEAFTQGDCVELAIALHNATGYPVVTISGPENWEFVHAAVRTPEGQILDIEGLWDEASWMDRWKGAFDAQDLVEEYNWDGSVHVYAWADGGASISNEGLWHNEEPTDWVQSILTAATA